MKRTAKGSIQNLLIILLMATFVVSCTSYREDMEPDFSYPAEKKLMDDDLEIMGRDQQDPIVSVPLAKDIFVPQPLEKSDALPDVKINGFNAVDATILETIRLLVLDEGISVSADPTFTDTRITIFDLNGSLQEVLDRVSEVSGIYYVYKNGLLTVTPARTFIVPLPPLEDSFDGVSSVVSAFGAESVNVDTSSRLLTFVADRKSYDNIRSYLNRVKENKVLIVYETYVLEVVLNDDTELGINWSNFNTRLNDADAASPLYDLTTSGGTNVSSTVQTFVFGASRTQSEGFNFNTTLQFLRTQGNVEIVSKPTITLISGNKATFEVGQETTYVAEVETTFQVVNSEERPVTSITPDVVVTGLRVELGADYADETVYSNIKLEIADLVGLPIQQFATGLLDGGATGDPIFNSVTLPITTTRSLETTVRARPGDTILMAGINQSRDEADYESVPLLGADDFATGKDTNVERTEIVIIMTPRVIRFDAPEDARAIAAEKNADPLFNNDASPASAPAAAPALTEQAPAKLLNKTDYQGLPLPRPNDQGQYEVQPYELLEQDLPDLGPEDESVLIQDSDIDSLLKDTESPPLSATVDSPPEQDGAIAAQGPAGEDPFFGKVQYFHKDGSVNTSK